METVRELQVILLHLSFRLISSSFSALRRARAVSASAATAESVLLLAYLLINKQSMRILDPLLLSFVYLVSSHNDEYNVEPLVQVDYFLVTLYTHLKAYQQPLRQWQCINWLSNLSCQRDSDGRRR